MVLNRFKGVKWQNKIYANDYENYFLLLDYLRTLKQYIKVQNAITKKLIIWNAKDENQNHFGPEEPTPLKDLEIINVSQIFFEPKFLNTDDILAKMDMNNVCVNELKNSIERLHTVQYAFEGQLECCSPFRFRLHMFAKISVLVQELAYERFDWSNTLVGRTASDTVFRVRMVGRDEKHVSKIVFEIKSTSLEKLNEFKSQAMAVMDTLFSFYPGLYFYKVFSYKTN
jgi:hypothetical protein